MTLNLNPAGSGENLRVQKKEPRYNVGRYNVKITMYNCLLPEFHLTGALRRVLTGVPYYGALLRLLSYSNLDPIGSGEIFGPPNRAPLLGKAK